MKKMLVVSLMAAVMMPISVFASDPCATELCLSSKVEADKTTMCKDPIDDFFKIKKKKHGVWNVERTLQARRDYIYNCQSGNRTEKEYILATYGMILK